MITIEQMVQREVLCCMSSLVSTLAQGYVVTHDNDANDINDLCEQASELASPVLDYQEAAIQAGWRLRSEGTPKTFEEHTKHGVGLFVSYTSWQELCEQQRIDPYEREVYEHWAVSQWFAEKLQAQGERVDTNFAGLNVWARTCTGQAISIDGVVQKIYREMVK